MDKVPIEIQAERFISRRGFLVVSDTSIGLYFPYSPANEEKIKYYFSIFLGEKEPKVAHMALRMDASTVTSTKNWDAAFISVSKNSNPTAVRKLMDLVKKENQREANTTQEIEAAVKEFLTKKAARRH